MPSDVSTTNVLPANSDSPQPPSTGDACAINAVEEAPQKLASFSMKSCQGSVSKLDLKSPIIGGNSASAVMELVNSLVVLVSNLLDSTNAVIEQSAQSFLPPVRSRHPHHSDVNDVAPLLPLPTVENAPSGGTPTFDALMESLSLPHMHGGSGADTVQALVSSIRVFHRNASQTLERLMVQLRLTLTDVSTSFAASPLPVLAHRPYLSIDDIESLSSNSSLSKQVINSLRTALQSGSSTSSCMTHHFLLSLPSHPRESGGGEGASIIELPVVPSLEASSPAVGSTQPPSQGQSILESAAKASASPPEKDPSFASQRASKPLVPHVPDVPITNSSTPRRALLHEAEIASPLGLLPRPADDASNGATDTNALVLTTLVHRNTDELGFKNINQYMILGDLGHGSEGKVKLALDTNTNRTVAIKIVRRARGNSLMHAPAESMAKAPTDHKESLRREVALMKQVRHPNVVSFYEFIDDPSNQKMFLVMQYADKGSVATINSAGKCSKVFPFAELLDIATQAARGLRYLHRRKIIHHDIKPENMLSDSVGNIMLADFGVSEFRCKYCLPSEDLEMAALLTRSDGLQVGTPLFMAPEVLLQEENENDGFDVRAAVDVWALGVSLFTLFSGQSPFVCLTPPVRGQERLAMETLGTLVKNNVSNGSVQRLLHNASTMQCHEQSCYCFSIQRDWENLLVSMMSIDPNDRPVAAAVYTTVKELAAKLRDGGSAACPMQSITGVTSAEIENAFTAFIPKVMSQRLPAQHVADGVYNEAAITKTSFRLAKGGAAPSSSFGVHGKT